MSVPHVRRITASQFTEEDFAAIKQRVSTGVETGAGFEIEWLVDEYGDVISVLDETGESLFGFSKVDGTYHLIEATSSSVIARSDDLCEVLDAIPDGKRADKSGEARRRKED